MKIDGAMMTDEAHHNLGAKKKVLRTIGPSFHVDMAPNGAISTLLWLLSHGFLARTIASLVKLQKARWRPSRPLAKGFSRGS